MSNVCFEKVIGSCFIRAEWEKEIIFPFLPLKKTYENETQLSVLSLPLFLMYEWFISSGPKCCS